MTKMAMVAGSGMGALFSTNTHFTIWLIATNFGSRSMVSYTSRNVYPFIAHVETVGTVNAVEHLARTVPSSVEELSTLVISADGGGRQGCNQVTPC